METILALDHQIMTYIVQYLHSDVLTAVMRFFSFLGDHGLLWLLIGVPLLLYPKTRRWGLTLIISLAIAALLSEYGIKFLIQRSRPFLQFSELAPLIPPPSGYSFPSSHATTAFACATVLFAMKKPVGCAAYVAAALISFSRVYLCVHFPSDVTAGALLGIVLGVAITLIVRHIAERVHYSRLR